ncbi:hypothetical protein FRB90_000526 [Tulasnella sp. 427]|nr:hypothetical protein FRB90_011009 [Tulasnella sp. 427]KAG9017611.1 hypothetical protein FRB90_000526 [Tulasnella sp. 427]
MASSAPGPSRQRAHSNAVSISVSSNSSDGYYDTDDELDIFRKQQQKEWEEGIEQLQVLVSAVLIPVIGKYLGRRWSGWLFDRYLHVGLGKVFFFGERLAAFIKLPSPRTS